MENDSQAMVVGLGAGLGGFIGFLIIIWIIWHICCGSWCEKKKVQPKIAPISIRDRHKMKNEPPIKMHSNVTTVTSINSKSVYLDLQSCLSNNKSLR